MQKNETIRLQKGRYKLVEPLASGGQGTIWKVEDKDKQFYALKVVNLYDTRYAIPKRHSDANLAILIKYAKAEIAFLTSLDTTKVQHIAICLDQGAIEEEGIELPAFIMPLYQQDDLEKRIKQHQDEIKPISRALWLRWFRQLMLALQSIQADSSEARLVAHRDLKPANCLFDDDDNLFLSDFGIVRESSKTGLTSVSTVGTRDFCAPEQCFARYEGEDGIPHFYITLTLDIYSAAMILHQILAGSTSAQQSLTDTSINQHKQKLYALGKATQGKVGKLGEVGGLSPDERTSLEGYLNDLLTPPQSGQTLAFHQPTLPNYQLIATDLTTLIENMLAPWPDDRPTVKQVLLTLASINNDLEPVLNTLAFEQDHYTVSIGKPLSLNINILGIGLPDIGSWLQIRLNQTPLENPQIKHIKAGRYQLTLPAFTELKPQTVQLFAEVNGKDHRAQVQIEVIPDADYLWTMGKRPEALSLELRTQWLDQWEAEATTVSKKFPLLEALTRLQTQYPEQAHALQERYDRINGRKPEREPLPLKKIGIATVVIAIGTTVAINWQSILQTPNTAEEAASVDKKPLSQTTRTEDQVEQIATLLDTVKKPAKKPFEPEMVTIKAGRFKMGCVSGKNCEPDEKPVHTVSVNAFELAKTEVTFEQWDACVSAKGCSHKPDDEGWGRGKRPVMNVSWNDTQDYIKWLNKETDKHYRLPSEAEWEYAARAGTTTQYWWGNKKPSCSKKDKNGANFDGGKNSYCYYKPDGNYKGTEVVASYTANAWNLYDMHGNVWEWVQDKWHDNYKKAPSNGDVWESADGAYRVLRGGSWDFTPQSMRSANRIRYTPVNRDSDNGFRLARSPVK